MVLFVTAVTLPQWWSCDYSICRAIASGIHSGGNSIGSQAREEADLWMMSSPLMHLDMWQCFNNGDLLRRYAYSALGSGHIQIGLLWSLSTTMSLLILEEDFVHTNHTSHAAFAYIIATQTNCQVIHTYIKQWERYSIKSNKCVIIHSFRSKVIQRNSYFEW